MPVGYPVINGNRFDFSSVELQLNGRRYIGVKAINYKQEIDPGEVRGTAPQLLGRTRGTYKAEGSIELYREEFADLCSDLQALAVGFLEANFLCTVTYSELPPNGIPNSLPSPVQTDTLVGLRFKSDDHSMQSGSSDPIVVKLEFTLMYLMVNGSLPVNNLLKLGAAV